MSACARRAGPLSRLVFLVLLRLLLFGGPALADPALLDDLHYRLEALVWSDAARVRVTLKRLGPDRFAAEVVGEPRGFVKVLTGERRERLATEMVWRHARLLPLVYQEETWRRGKRRLKEYRFDHDRNRLEMWQSRDGQAPVRKWRTDLSEPVFDPLSAFYNCRLGLLGPTRPGETVTIPGIPYPRPEAMEVRLGPETREGRQAMVSLVNPVFEDSRGVVFASLDKRLAPLRVWTTVFGVTITGRLLPESTVMPPALPGLTAPAPVAAR